MDIRQSNFWMKFYNGFYGEYPKSICYLFFPLILAIGVTLISPLAILFFLIDNIVNKKVDLEGFGAMCIVHQVVTLFSTCFGLFYLVEGGNYTFWHLLFGLLTFISLIAGVVIIWTLMDLFIEWRRVKRLNSLKYFPPKEPNLLWESLKAFKSKICPRINIIYDEK